MFARKRCLKHEESKASNQKQGYLHSSSSSSREISRTAHKGAALELGTRCHSILPAALALLLTLPLHLLEQSSQLERALQ